MGQYNKQKNDAKDKLDVSNRIKQQYQDNHLKFGARNNNQEILHMEEDYKKGVTIEAEKFHLHVDENLVKIRARVNTNGDDSTLVPDKYFMGGLTAKGCLNNTNVTKWLKKHNLGQHYSHVKKQKDFIQKVFEAIDEDGSGTMDQEELIKALLCMGLSQDVGFAKRVLKTFKENQDLVRQKLLKKKIRMGEAVAEKKSKFSRPKNEGTLEFSLKDFLSIFQEDLVGAKIVMVINQEV